MSFRVCLIGSMVGTLATVTRVHSHGAVTFPPPRNSIDRNVAPWNGTVPAYPIPFDSPNWCAKSDSTSGDPRNLTGSNGQACFWFSNGCDIGSGSCDGNSGQVIPCCTPKFKLTGNGTAPPDPWGPEGIVVDEDFVKSFDRNKLRPKNLKYPERKATICDPRLRTLNTHAECGSPADFWYNAPWRYPGITPVIDSCGAAGGRLPGQGPAPGGGAGATYVNTSNAKLSDVGSKLPPLMSGTVWSVGSAVEVAWTQKAWHGGGYQYRLCPANMPLTEECFQKMPLPFVGNASLRWGGVGGEQMWFNTTERGWDVSVGTVPEGSMWRKVPLPRGPWNWRASGPSFQPVCEESEECRTSAKAPRCLGPDKPCTCKCSGDGIGDLPMLEMVDMVQLPAGLVPGSYVLGWRWDCEESTQVWTSCSDVTITA
eukprot:m.670883 g.670883  ORF g.670883 m.670883 type:complete len:425 (-) comp22767_c0_seq24:1317-2591(-)